MTAIYTGRNHPKLNYGMTGVAMNQAMTSLTARIGMQVVARDRLIERIQWLEKKVRYRDKRIRELSAQRRLELNLKLKL
jgi:hypothetical protein